MKQFAVIGYPLTHTLSPAMQTYVLERLEIDATYVSMPIDGGEINAVGHKLRSGELDGINITLPYKTAVLDFLDDLDEIAQLAGAANCAGMRDGMLLGTNTDVAGIKWAFSASGQEVRDKRVMILGSGGAARAAILALRDLGAASISLAGRKPDALKKLTAEFLGLKDMPPMKHAMVDEHMALDEYEIIINATPIGMWPALDNSPIDPKQLNGSQAVFDMIYRPDPTRLISGAAEMGCHTVSGLDMFIGQGLASLMFWFPQLSTAADGFPAGIDVDDLRRHLHEKMD